jgi:Nif-specific regulatory protein
MRRFEPEETSWAIHRWIERGGMDTDAGSCQPCSMGDMEDLERTKKERDLYLRLLQLGHHQEARPFLEESLRLIVDATGALRGYIEVHSAHDAHWSMSQGCTSSEVEMIQAVVSRGIVQYAMASGTTIHTPSALLDERFAKQTSVRLHGIEAVLCTPLGGETPIGVLYLQGHAGGGPFNDDDIQLAETFARHVTPVLERVAKSERDRSESDFTARWRDRLDIGGIIGRSAALATVLEEVAMVARFEINVLLLGPSGAGKTHLARAIHDNGPRRIGPFLEMNCTNLTEGLFESELFGAVAGSHSTADHDRPGRIAAASGGTLLLDEIGELPLSVQAKLLQVLQSRTYFPLGGSAKTADVRFIAATNADLKELVRSGRFREDLYHRIAVVTIRLPSLSERPEDIVPLGEHLIAEASRSSGLPRLPFSSCARAAIQSASWQGNVRELSNALQAALFRAAAQDAATIEARHVFPDLSAEPNRPLTFHEATRQFQRGLLESTLIANDWNVAETARQLDIARAHIYNLTRAHGLVRK